MKKNIFTVFTTYGCERSSAETGKVASALVNQYGYSSAKFSDYDHTKIYDQIYVKKQPVILKGGRKSGWWIFGSFKDGHAWVCDGWFRKVVRDPIDCSGYEETLLHMNWGLIQTYFNGWYNNNSSWSVGEDSYNYQRGMVYDIVPGQK